MLSALGLALVVVEDPVALNRSRRLLERRAKNAPYKLKPRPPRTKKCA